MSADRRAQGGNGTVTPADAAVLIQVQLVPVEVFGVGCDNCCDEGGTFVCEKCGHQGHHGYGLSDAVSAWSDCNRAEGHIFRFDDVDPQYRQPGETLTVWVRRDEYKAFAARRWMEGEHAERWAHHPGRCRHADDDGHCQACEDWKADQRLEEPNA